LRKLDRPRVRAREGIRGASKRPGQPGTPQPHPADAAAKPTILPTNTLDPILRMSSATWSDPLSVWPREASVAPAASFKSITRRSGGHVRCPGPEVVGSDFGSDRIGPSDSRNRRQVATASTSAGRVFTQTLQSGPSHTLRPSRAGRAKLAICLYRRNLPWSDGS
jgi:hypothetical protein